jgi:hypothetical protein
MNLLDEAGVMLDGFDTKLSTRIMGLEILSRKEIYDSTNTSVEVEFSSTF